MWPMWPQTRIYTRTLYTGYYAHTRANIYSRTAAEEFSIRAEGRGDNQAALRKSLELLERSTTDTVNQTGLSLQFYQIPLEAWLRLVSKVRRCRPLVDDVSWWSMPVRLLGGLLSRSQRRKFQTSSEICCSAEGLPSLPTVFDDNWSSRSGSL